MGRLSGKCIYITGASGGIGRETALKAAEEGAKLVLLARSLDKLTALKDELAHRFRTESYAYKLDVGSPEEVEAVFKKAAIEAGEADILVNNAGFGTFKEAVDTEIEEAQKMFNVNVIGLMACTKMVLPSMKRRRSGQIINVASQAAKIATPKSSLYSSTKFAVLGYSNALRLELLEDNITVTTVNPGPIETDFFEIADESGSYKKNIAKFMLKPDDVAGKITAAMLTKKREVNLPGYMNAAGKLYNLFPGISERVGKRAFFKK